MKNQEYEVHCPKCGAYFMLISDSTDDGFIYGECPECMYEGEMDITDLDEE